METNKHTDHILLKADATYDKVEMLYVEAKGCDFTSVCVSSYWVSAYAELLKRIDVKVCTVVGSPLGAMNTEAKAFGTAAATADGAKEVDMVLNIGEMEAGHYDTMCTDAKAVVETAEGNCVEVTLGDCLLIKEGIVKVCKLCVEAGAAFIRTSTGFSTDEATSEDTKLMKDTMKERCPVRAAGEVRCYEDMERAVKAGADRTGASVGIKLIQKETSDNGY